jgi:hypothetical protein
LPHLWYSFRPKLGYIAGSNGVYISGDVLLLEVLRKFSTAIGDGAFLK